MVMTRMPLTAQFAGNGQSHRDHAALGRRISGLPDLTLEGGHRCGIDDDAALAGFVGRVARHGGGCVTHHVERANQIDLHHLGEQASPGGSVFAQDFFRRRDTGAVDETVQGAECARGRLDRRPAAGLVGDVGENEAGGWAEFGGERLTGFPIHIGNGDSAAAGDQHLARWPPRDRKRHPSREIISRSRIFPEGEEGTQPSS
jgi:hypothetical protein